MGFLGFGFLCRFRIWLPTIASRFGAGRSTRKGKHHLGCASQGTPDFWEYPCETPCTSRCHGQLGGSLWLFGGFGVGYKKSVALWRAGEPKQNHGSIEECRCWGRSPVGFGAFWAIPTSHGSFSSSLIHEY